MTIRQDRFIKNLPTAKTPTQAARDAGYASPARAAHQLLHDEKIQKKIQALGNVGLDTLEDVARNGKVEIARVQAAKTMVETAYGRPKDNKTTNIGDVTINVVKLGDVPNLIDQ